MGCFNVACNLTNVSMGFDKAVWVPLIYSNPNGKPCYGGNHFIYPIAVFTPIACPVFGKVNSYGSLDEIERTPNVEVIEKFFKASIDDIIYEPGNFKIKDIKNGQLSGTFINRDAFEWSKKNTFDDGGKNITNLLNSYMNDGVLNICGFNFVHEDNTRERYNKLYVSKRYPNIKWWSDGTWGNFDNEKYCSVYNPVDFFKFLKKKTGIDPDPKVLTKLKNTWSTLYNLKQNIIEVNKSAEMWNKYKTDTTDDFDVTAYDRQKLYSWCQQEGSRWETKDVFDKMYGHNLELYVKDLANLLHLNTVLFINNRFWSPQTNGFQGGSLYQEKATAQWIINRANKNIKEYEYEIEEENNEYEIEEGK